VSCQALSFYDILVANLVFTLKMQKKTTNLEAMGFFYPKKQISHLLWFKNPWCVSLLET